MLLSDLIVFCHQELPKRKASMKGEPGRPRVAESAGHGARTIHPEPPLRRSGADASTIRAVLSKF